MKKNFRKLNCGETSKQCGAACVHKAYKCKQEDVANSQALHKLLKKENAALTAGQPMGKVTSASMKQLVALDPELPKKLPREISISYLNSNNVTDQEKKAFADKATENNWNLDPSLGTNVPLQEKDAFFERRLKNRAALYEDTLNKEKVAPEEKSRGFFEGTAGKIFLTALGATAVIGAAVAYNQYVKSGKALQKTEEKVANNIDAAKNSSAKEAVDKAVEATRGDNYMLARESYIQDQVNAGVITEDAALLKLHRNGTIDNRAPNEYEDYIAEYSKARYLENQLQQNNLSPRMKTEYKEMWGYEVGTRPQGAKATETSRLGQAEKALENKIIQDNVPPEDIQDPNSWNLENIVAVKAELQNSQTLRDATQSGLIYNKETKQYERAKYFNNDADSTLNDFLAETELQFDRKTDTTTARGELNEEQQQVLSRINKNMTPEEAFNAQREARLKNASVENVSVGNAAGISHEKVAYDEVNMKGTASKGSPRQQIEQAMTDPQQLEANPDLESYFLDREDIRAPRGKKPLSSDDAKVAEAIDKSKPALTIQKESIPLTREDAYRQAAEWTDMPNNTKDLYIDADILAEVSGTDLRSTLIETPYDSEEWSKVANTISARLEEIYSDENTLQSLRKVKASEIANDIIDFKATLPGYGTDMETSTETVIWDAKDAQNNDDFTRGVNNIADERSLDNYANIDTSDMNKKTNNQNTIETIQASNQKTDNIYKPRKKKKQSNNNNVASSNAAAKTPLRQKQEQELMAYMAKHPNYKGMTYDEKMAIIKEELDSFDAE